MAKRNESITHTEYTNAFKRQKSIPLDSSSVFYGTSSKLKEDYSSKDTSGAYVGQIVSVVNSTASNSDTDAYIILNEQGDLDKITLKSEIDNLSLSEVGSNSNFIYKVSQTAGQLSASAGTAEKGIQISSGKIGHSTIGPNATFPDQATGSVSYSGTFKVPKVTIDSYGHVTYAQDVTITLPSQYSLPTASATIKGGIKVGTHLIMNSETMSVNPDFGSGVTIKAGTFNAYSDARLKENFEYIQCGNILDLPTYKFDYINGAKNQIGCKAQDLQKICPELVDENEDGYLTIQESKIVYLLLEEVKKLRKEIDELKDKL